MKHDTLQRCSYPAMSSPPSRSSLQMASAQRDACKIREAADQRVEDIMSMRKPSSAKCADSSSNKKKCPKNEEQDLIGGEKVRVVNTQGW